MTPWDGVGPRAAETEETIAAMDAKPEGALIGTTEEEETREDRVAEEKRAQAGAAGTVTEDERRHGSLRGRRACIPRGLLEMSRVNPDPKNGRLRGVRMMRGRSKVL